jgi:hypothetical protein
VTRQFLTALFIGSVLAMGCGPARAHSFNLGFVTTLTGPHASRGKQALDGFLLATGERDAHPGEESDGHLGGLDVYVFRIDSNLGAEAVRRRLRELLRGQRLMFVTGVYEPGVMEAVDEAVRRLCRAGIHRRTANRRDRTRFGRQSLGAGRVANSARSGTHGPALISEPTALATRLFSGQHAP